MVVAEGSGRGRRVDAAAAAVAAAMTFCFPPANEDDDDEEDEEPTTKTRLINACMMLRAFTMKSVRDDSMIAAFARRRCWGSRRRRQSNVYA